MPGTGRLIIESGVFHILCRGNNRQRIFEKDPDYRYYLDLLKNYKADHKFFLYHYCLMPNHVHLLLETTVPTDLPKLMKQPGLSYYFYIAPGFSMALDVKRLIYDKQTDVSVGTEYRFIPGFALRMGYMMSRLDAKNKGFSVGLGVNLLNTQFDYSVTPFGVLGDAQRISLKKKF